MKRIAVLLVVVAGCQQSNSRPVPETQQLPAENPQPSTETPPSSAVDIEFSKWPTATDLPVDVSPAQAQACGPGYNGSKSRWAHFGGANRHGPHFGRYIVVRINPDAEQEFKELAAPLPVGTVVVKEKHSEFLPKGPPSEYGAMIKREAGYDREHGDWEYLYAVRGPEEKVTRGRLESCIECHSHAKHRDYVFRTYLKADGVSEW